MKNAYVTFIRTVMVEDVGGLSQDEIKSKAVDVFNEAEMDDFYADEDNIVSVDIEDED